jgi:hypothetical protein
MSSIINAGTSGLVLTGSTTTTLSLATNGTTRATIDASGNVSLASGNLTFSSTGQRITGDFSNATLTSRLAFQTSTTDGATRLMVLPNGTSTTSAFNLLNTSDANNASYLTFACESTVAAFRATNVGTGTLLPMTWVTGGSERMRLSTTGELGLGVAAPTIPLQIGKGGGGNPATSGTTQTYGIARIGSSGAAALDVGTYAAGQVWMQGVNVTNLATNYDLVLQPNGGNVGIGTTPNVELALYKATTPRFHIQNSTSGTQVNDGFQLALSGSDAYIWNFENGASIFGTNNTERMRIDSSGNVGIGGTATAYDKVMVGGTLPSGSLISVNFAARGVTPSSSTSQSFGFGSAVGTQAASFTLGSLYHFYATQGTFGASSAVTNQYGYFVENTLTGATNNYGFYSNIASGSNRWNVYMAGTAQNYFAGGTSFLTTDLNPATSNVEGVAINSSRQLSASVDGEVVRINRKATDGVLINFYQDGVAEGNISVSGNTVSYNAFAGSHWSQLQDGSKPDILRGTVMESINELCGWPDGENERLPKSKVSDTAGSKKVYGVFMAWDNDWTETNDMLVTSVGAFICRVNSNVTVQEGDLLESNGDGTARVQTDDIIRSSTIGKVTSTVKTHQYADGSYCVPTVLYCG